MTDYPETWEIGMDRLIRAIVVTALLDARHNHTRYTRWQAIIWLLSDQCIPYLEACNIGQAELRRYLLSQTRRHKKQIDLPF